MSCAVKMPSHLGAVLCFALLLGGCANLQGAEFAAYDRSERFNRASFNFSERVDRAVLKPVARGYRWVTPDPIERSISNFFANLRSVDNMINNTLQGKFRSTGSEFSRFAINTTLGVAGLFDVASRVGVAERPEDFGQTLAVWGVKRSRYVYLPLMGPTTVRDAPSLFFRAWLPRGVLGSVYNVGLTGVDAVSQRADVLSATDARDAAALDPYAFTRDAYYQRRKHLIFDGSPPVEDFFDEFDFDDEDLDGETPANSVD